MHEMPVLDDSTRLLVHAAIAAASDTGRPDRAWLEEAAVLADSLPPLARPATQDEVYGRRVIAKTSKAEAVLVHWARGATSAPHDHGSAKGFVLVISGEIIERRFTQFEGRIEATSTRTVRKGEALCIDTQTVHEMIASSDAITLHIYAPSCEGMRVVDTRRSEWIPVPSGHGAWIPRERRERREIVWVGFTTHYRGGSDEFRIAARTLAEELEAKFPQHEIRLEAMTTKADFIRAMSTVDQAHEAIRELHFVGHSGMYGVMFGSTAWPEQLSPHEWRTLHIPFAEGAEAYFHACRTARWFAPFFARTFNVVAHGNQGYTTVSTRKDRFRWAGPSPSKHERLYLVAAPGKKSHGYVGSLRKYAGVRIDPMRSFSPTTLEQEASYDAVAKLYDEAFADIRVREREWTWLVDKLDAHRGPRKPRVLDIGCGNGALLASLGDRIEKGVGVDVSVGMIDAARERHATRTHLSFERIDGPELPFADDSFDIVISFLSFRYLDWDPMMKEVARVLARGGRFFVVDMVEKPVEITEAKSFVKSALRHIKQHATERSFSRKLSALTSHPDWKRMLTHNPMRAEHEYRWYFESRFPGRTVETLDVARRSRIIAFDSGELDKRAPAPLSYP